MKTFHQATESTAFRTRFYHSGRNKETLLLASIPPLKAETKPFFSPLLTAEPFYKPEPEQDFLTELFKKRVHVNLAYSFLKENPKGGAKWEWGVMVKQCPVKSRKRASSLKSLSGLYLDWENWALW